MTLRHFLTLTDIDPPVLQDLIEHACELKREYKEKKFRPLLQGRVLAMIFEKSSTRTRVSFEAAMAQLGGHSIFLSPEYSQLGRGEPLEDTARVLSKMVDGVMIRTYEHEKLVQFAANSDIPVINGLSDSYHPCQLLADMQTYYEARGSIQGKKVAWVGDGNNMCHSYINAARAFDFRLSIACPPSYRPSPLVLAGNEDIVEVTTEPEQAVADADLWSLMCGPAWGRRRNPVNAGRYFSNFRSAPVSWRRRLRMRYSCIVFPPIEVRKSPRM